MGKKSIKDLDVKGKKVLVRVDFNVPLDDGGNITDDTRIRKSLPTIKNIIEKGGRAILVSHLGRPKGKVVDKLRMDPIAKRLEELLGSKVKKVNDCIGSDVEGAVSQLKDGDVLLLENVRFHPEEEKNDEEFSKKLAGLSDVYINDAFGTAHRAHASTEGVAKFRPGICGFLMEKEIDSLGKVLRNPEKPFIAILGGVKVSGKIGVIKNLIGKVDQILIGGAMSYTFDKAQGLDIGSSKVEDDRLELADELLKEASSKGTKLITPKDHFIADGVDAGAKTKVVNKGEIPDGWLGVDIGPATIEEYSNVIKTAKTVVWNGPMGIFEIEPFSKGTVAIANAVASAKGIFSVVGGGDSVAAIEKIGVADKITHVSTGGGASLEFLEGKKLPGIAVLQDA